MDFLINPKKEDLDILQITKKSKSAKPSESFRKAVPGLNVKYSEEQFLDLLVNSKQQKIVLHTYRENAKNISEASNPKALIIYMHGLFDHQNRVAHIAHHFAERGYTVVGFDYRGHGKSQGLFGYINDHNDLVNDLIEFTRGLDLIYSKQVPRFLIGESMGGLTGFLSAEHLPNYFKGMIFLAPALKKHSKLNCDFRLVRCLSYICKEIPFPLPQGNDQTKNPAVWENYQADRLIYHGGIRFGTIRSLDNGMRASERKMENFNVPFLMVQGGSDGLVDFATNFSLMEKAKTHDKTFLYFKNAWHDLPHEEEIGEILKFASQWIEERIVNSDEIKL